MSEPGRSTSPARAGPSWRDHFPELGQDIQEEVDRSVPEPLPIFRGVALIRVDLATHCGTDRS
jgi:hypothetical protein